MLRKAFFILLAGVVIYLFVATVYPKAWLVGVFGEFVGKLDFKLFGYLSVLFDMFLMWIVYLFYKKSFDYKTSLRVLGAVVLFFDLLFIQALVLKKGIIGVLFVDTLRSYIGLIGVLILVLIIGSWGAFLIWEEKILNLLRFKSPSLLQSKNPEPTKATPQTQEDIDQSPEKTNQTKEIAKQNIQQSPQPPKEQTPQNSQNDEEIWPELDESEAAEVLNEINPQEIKEETKEIKEEALKSEIQEPQTQEEPKETIEREELKEVAPAKTALLTEEEKVKKVEELEDTKKLLSEIELGEREKPKDWKFPPLNILQSPPEKKREINEAEIDKKIKTLLEKLKYFKIEGDVVRYYVGPVVTTFEFKPLPHIKVSKILALQDDLAMALKAQSIRIQAPIPGKDVVGIEIPNETREMIYLREILENDIFQKAKSPLTIALGKDVVGSPFVTDLAKLPHLLVAGTTGSGKSVGINAMILSLLYRNTPDELKFVMIDPKQLEFSTYNDIPHLLTPVITEPKQAITALNAMVKEMERRYKIMKDAKVKNIEGYNKKSDEKLPYIVIIIDELADLMMTSGKDVEYAIARLAQMARASGIHLIVATQRPSVDVVTGLIKANLPSRISFKVGQKIDSKVILDQYGAETLLGNGDMLFTPPGIVGLLRLHAPFVSEEEIEEVVEFLKSQREPEYDDSVVTMGEEADGMDEDEEVDELFEKAKEIILKERRTSISYIQRRLQIGYNRAANIIEQMERKGILSPANAKGQREILI
ncbi:MAG: DUF87 domain-containing protein [Epsilonproteobacteria bacterium]|nr:DUF87 domain-containing protein [Campylobacterota bacterium]